MKCNALDLGLTLGLCIGWLAVFATGSQVQLRGLQGDEPVAEGVGKEESSYRSVLPRRQSCVCRNKVVVLCSDHGYPTYHAVNGVSFARQWTWFGPKEACFVGTPSQAVQRAQELGWGEYFTTETNWRLFEVQDCGYFWFTQDEYVGGGMYD